MDSNPDPSGLLTKEQRKNLIVVVSQTLVSKYLLTSYYYIEHSYQHYYLNKGQLISEGLFLSSDPAKRQRFFLQFSALASERGWIKKNTVY